MLNSSTHLMRSSRWKWVDSTSILDLAPAVMELADGTQIDAIDEAEGLSSFIDAAPGNGTVLATGDGLPWIVEWEAGVEYYDGAGQTAGGPRVFFVAGTGEVEGVSNWGEWNLTPAGQAIYMDTVNKLLPAVELDVTVPGDIVLGVPNDGLMDGDNFGWPGAETPPLAIDDNTGTKFLHFKGELEPTGFQVTPLNGPSIVTGLTLTTANDEPPRDPVAFELYGSNVSIDGPYELIASGDIVDFAQADAWPRFTKNETPISFNNGAVYDHYQVLFPAVRDAASANSMQIAEVELIGVPAPTPADVTALGDAIQGVPNDGLMSGDNFGWPPNETPDLAIDDNKRTKFLHFKGELEPTGFQVTPSAGPTIVTGLTLITANDEPPRDPIAFELSGSNESIDGPYELIAVGDIVDFAQADAWPRFRMNATPISFDNTVAYAHYQVLFPAVRDAGSANSMQIAEVELIGLPAPAGPVAQWTLDDGAGTIAADSSGNGNDGVLIGEPLWVAGIIGGALELDGVDDYVDCGNPSMLDFGTGDFTISAWINLTAIERATVYAKGGDNSGGIRYTLAMGEANDNQMTLTTDDNSSKVQARGGTVVNDGAWHHVVGMRAGTVSMVYVDGILDGSIDLPEGYDLSGASQHNALIGAITSNTDGSLEKLFAGIIDDVRIYDRALSADEVSELAAAAAAPVELVAAFAFGAQLLDCPTFNDPAVNYTMVHHESPEALQYDPGRGYGYEVIYPVDSPFGDRSGYGKFGPFDDSPNNRGDFGDECPEELYDSFIGAKDFSSEVSAATMGDMDTPSPNPEGIIFRVDVPNGLYRFVGAFADADNVHAHRILAEDGGSGPPENIGANYVVLVSNHDQAQQTIGEPDAAEPGEGVYARVGFDGLIPPPGDGVFPSPQFVDMDENGMPTDAGASSPILEVTQGYIRIHQLQGNSNDGPGGPKDVNGGDIVILELWSL